MRRSEGRWRGLFDRMSEGFFVAQATRDRAGAMVDFRFLEVNPAFETADGRAHCDAALGRPVTQVIPGVQRELIEAYARVVDSGWPEEFEVLVPRTERPMVRGARPGDRPRPVLGAVPRDHRAQGAQVDLARSAQRYRTLFESINKGCALSKCCWTPDGQPA